MKRVLVTGSAGFLGYYLASALADRNDCEVICVDNFVRGERDDAYQSLCDRSNVRAIEADLNEPAEIEKLPEQFDTIFHMAALNGTQNFYERPFDVVRCCTLPTLNLLSRYATCGLSRFIYAGTSEAYASSVSRFGWEVPTGEDVPLGIDDVMNVRWSYAASKMHGEVAVVAAAAAFAMPFTIVRFHNAYGPRMGDKHVVPDFYNRARNGVFELYGYEDTRSFIYADDAARATMMLADAPAAEGQIVNVGGADETRIEDLGRSMMKAAGLSGEITLHPSPAGSVKRRAPKLDQLRALTEFKESVSLEEGLSRTAQFYLGGQSRLDKFRPKSEID